MAKGPQLGDTAPDFTLEGTDGTFTLHEHRGRRVVLMFYPGDETMVCTKQFCSYRDRADDLSALDALVVGVSGQDMESHAAFTAHHGLTVPLLADVDRVASKAYGVDRGRLGVQRAAFVVDAEGVLRYKKLHRLGLDFVTIDQLGEALATAG